MMTHEWLGNSLLVLVPLHVLAALLESRREGDNLIAAMLHGYKHADMPVRTRQAGADGYSWQPDEIR